MYHFSKSFEDEQRKERKRARRRRRKEMMLKPCRKEQTQPATFPVLVERAKASRTSSRHRTRVYLSPEFAPPHSAFESAENSDNEEYYGTRAKLPAPNSVGESSHQIRSRKKKKAIKVEEELTHSLYPSYLEGAPSKNGITFALDTPNRSSMDSLPARQSVENMLGGKDRPEITMRFKKPNKLPPIDKENRSLTDEYPYVLKRF